MKDLSSPLEKVNQSGPSLTSTGTYIPVSPDLPFKYEDIPKLSKRATIVTELLETEESYVHNLNEAITVCIYTIFLS